MASNASAEERNHHPVLMPAAAQQRDSSASFLSTSQSTSHTASTQRIESKPCQIFYGPKSVKARIDSNVPVSEIINQLVSAPQLQVSEPAALFALRDRADEELITDDNLGSRLENGALLKLVSSPLIEAAEMVERLATRDEKTLKLATFELKKYVQESTFMREFVQRGGLVECPCHSWQPMAPFNDFVCSGRCHRDCLWKYAVLRLNEHAVALDCKTCVGKCRGFVY